jgi:hypothetical protein
MPMVEIHVEDPRQMLQRISSALDENQDPYGRSRWAFRGVADATLPLIPKAFRRKHQPALQAMLQPGTEPFSAFDLENRVHAASRARSDEERCRESRLLELAFIFVGVVEGVRRFEEFADELGYPLGDVIAPDTNPWSLVDHHRAGVGVLDLATTSIALAQHHGLPTHLLDWTGRPEVATYFAAQYASSLETGHLAVYAVDLRKIDRVGGLGDTRIRRFHCPRHNMTFLHAQDGLFLIDTSATQMYYATGKWPDMAAQIADTQVILKFVLPLTVENGVTTGSKLLASLRKSHRISRAHLMPTLDSVVDTLMQTWGVNPEHR